MLFYFCFCVCVMTCLSLPLCKTNFKTFQKKCFIAQKMDEEKLHTPRNFSWRVAPRGNMRCKLVQKRLTRKTTECSKRLCHIAIEKDILSELNRCIFQISLKYIKLLFQKHSLYWYYAVLLFTPTWPPPNKITPPTI